MSEQVGDRFHAHLDVCRRCEDEPWNLCQTGAALLKQSAAEITNQFKHLYPTGAGMSEPGCSQHDWIRVHLVDDPLFLDRYVCKSCGEKKEFGLIVKVSAPQEQA